MKKLLFLIIIATALFAFASCGCEHEWREATCVVSKKCLKCGLTEGEPKGHTEVVDPGRAATCTDPGLTDGSHCSVCELVLKAREIIPATGHTEVTDAAVAPSCTEEGITEGSHCSVCGYVMTKQTRVAALGHSETVTPAKAPTCTEPGLTEGTHCLRCNYVFVEQQSTSALGHTEAVTPAKASTCTEPGLTEGTHCSRCNYVIVEQKTVELLPHTVEIDREIAATCTESGKSEGSHCSVCLTVIVPQETVPAKGHGTEYVPGVAATCTNKGLTPGVKCPDCGIILTAQNETEALGHNYKPEFVQATDERPAHGMYVCSRCGDSYDSDIRDIDIVIEETNCTFIGDQKKMVSFKVTASGGFDVLMYRYEVFESEESTEPTEVMGFSYATTYSFQSTDTVNGMVLRVTVKDRYGNIATESFVVQPAVVTYS